MESEAPAAPTIVALLAEASWLRRFARSLVDEASADDVVQETWASALARPPRLDAPLRPWLATVIRNVVRFRARGRVRRARREAETSWGEAVLPTPEELLARHRLLQAVADAVGGLDEPFRSTILLCYGEGLSPGEAAHRLGIPAGTARWRLHRGLALVRVRLDEQLREKHEPWTREPWTAALPPLVSPLVGRAPASHGWRDLCSALRGFGAPTRLLLAAGVAFLLWAVFASSPPVQGRRPSEIRGASTEMSQPSAPRVR